MPMPQTRNHNNRYCGHFSTASFWPNALHTDWKKNCIQDRNTAESEKEVRMKKIVRSQHSNAYIQHTKLQSKMFWCSYIRVHVYFFFHFLSQRVLICPRTVSLAGKRDNFPPRINRINHLVCMYRYSAMYAIYNLCYVASYNRKFVEWIFRQLNVHRTEISQWKDFIEI